MTVKDLQNRVSEMRNFFAPLDSCGRRLYSRVKRLLTLEEVNSLPVGALIALPSYYFIGSDGEFSGHGVYLHLNEEGEPVEAWTTANDVSFWSQRRPKHSCNCFY